MTGSKKNLTRSLDQDRRKSLLKNEIEENSLTLTIKRKSELLCISRKAVYSKDRDLIVNQTILDCIDEIYSTSPYFGQRRLRIILSRDHDIQAGRYIIRKCMYILGIKALYPKKNTSIPNPNHKKYPYLLKGLKIVRINQVWGCDITYIRLEHGWVYLVAIIDWYSRKVLSWKISVTLDTYFCILCLNEAVEKYGKPDIFNTDQGSQFTSYEFTDTLKGYEIRISMDGKGRWVDNVFTERLWRSLKQNEVYRNAYENPREALEGISRYFNKYNSYDPHQSLKYETPDNVYYGKDRNETVISFLGRITPEKIAYENENKYVLQLRG